MPEVTCPRCKGTKRYRGRLCKECAPKDKDGKIIGLPTGKVWYDAGSGA